MSSGLPNLPDPRLLADIGGTNARFAILSNGAIENVCVLDGAKYSSIDDAARAYLAQVDVTPKASAMAIAAPIVGDSVRMTNHSWQFSVAALRRELHLERLIVLNDFTALAMSLRYLPRDELTQLGGSRAVADSAIALLGPGTGLGVSGLVPHRDDTQTRWTPLQGEGGHVTLPAQSQREAAVIDLIYQRFGHVSAERAISGSGLINLYAAICSLDRVNAKPLQPSDVTDHALANSNQQCAEALRMFCAMLGTIAGDLALTLGAIGGVYIGGGIVPRLGDYFLNSEFRTRFEGKGRYREYLAAIPAFVIRSSAPAFYGLARSFVDSSPRVEASLDSTI
jgi:glucokinase